VTFEEYRYDALGRRIWLRSRRFCEKTDDFECKLSFMRRTVWDGNAELYEIQMPGWEGTPTDSLENDTLAVEVALVGPNQGDRNKYFGRVTYAYGLQLDRPLSVTRFRYADRMAGYSDLGWFEYPTFTIVPMWNARGKADHGYVASTGGKLCPDNPKPTRCLLYSWPAEYDVLAYHGWNTYPLSFQGTLLDDKHDQGGTWYRRNRNYDPASGRFTQEDPIGLAGGINLYGFAAGDPVNIHDPFGLNPCLLHPAAAIACAAAVAAAKAATTPQGQRAITRGSELVRNLAANGQIRRAGEAGHHIVARTAERAAFARDKLLDLGIKINDAANGVNLPATRDAVGRAANHLTLHTKEYYNAVNQAFQNVQTKEQAIEVLSAIRDRLLSGTFPH
jgi:RHS repeat-associated protein